MFAPGVKGNRYKHNDKLLADVSDASELILGTVLGN